MIDFHTHILPSIDDGAKTVADSEELLKRLKAQGVDTVLLTPHYYGKQYSVSDFVTLRDNLFHKISTDAPEGVKLVLGCEVYIQYSNTLNLAALAPLKIEGTSFILLELPFTATYGETIFNTVERLADVTGLIPIIAHVEKYPATLAKPQIITRLVEAGCLLQCNADSFIDVKYRGLARALLKRNLVHALGTDTHNLVARPPHYDKAKSAICSYAGEEAFENIQQSMRLILQDKRPDLYKAKPIRKLFGLYF